MYPENEHILVIDHDPRRRQVTERVLTDEGFAVTAVGEGFSALRTVARGRFALAIAAVQLPGMLDGITTLRQIRIRQPRLKALFVGDAETHPRGLNPDCDDFIGAPMPRHELLGCVFELLQRSHSRTHAG